MIDWLAGEDERMHEDTKREILAPVPSMGEVVNKAARHLPTGYRVLIEVEREGYNVRLEYPNCKTVSVDGGDGIISDVNEAICIANGFAS